MKIFWKKWAARSGECSASICAESEFVNWWNMLLYGAIHEEQLLTVKLRYGARYPSKCDWRDGPTSAQRAGLDAGGSRRAMRGGWLFDFKRHTRQNRGADKDGDRYRDLRAGICSRRRDWLALPERVFRAFAPVRVVSGYGWKLTRHRQFAFDRCIIQLRCGHRALSTPSIELPQKSRRRGSTLTRVQETVGPCHHHRILPEAVFRREENFAGVPTPKIGGRG
jgi:hypothetical protein